ncbi:DNA-binding domain-containing protein [Mesorhizobium qingshengii]|uniref:Putative DNA-binding domain-containing protein n=1 Tax=Mesorhizobium qingshengii TaxID=1165689 RepID=A0A1G5YPX0_9HYPH|nr:DNA-binding domain-containing protein [Mesorhizobium qingshengii]SDA84476.1 Putative DNA-binding domain-containing protein [Mesorhizobium qingshengii]
MLPLELLQTSMARSVLAIEPLVAAKMLTAGKADPLARLRIYQNNTRSSLTAVLMAVFPVTVRLVDERFFRFVASEFIRRHPPAESRLARYGAGFPRFLKTIDTLSDMPIVAETARLEWTIAEALDAACLPPRILAEYDSTNLGPSPDILLQPSLRLIVSHWSILSVWTAHQQEAAIDQHSAWTRRPQRVALWRAGDSVRLVLLDRANFAFRHSLKHGLGLEHATGRALALDPAFDLLAALVRLFGDGLVTDVRIPRHPLSN